MSDEEVQRAKRILERHGFVVGKASNFKVTRWFIDNSYWDDGNRTTSRIDTYPTLELAQKRVYQLLIGIHIESGQGANVKCRYEKGDIRLTCFCNIDIPI